MVAMGRYGIQNFILMSRRMIFLGWCHVKRNQNERSNKKPKQATESYSPQFPEIANMMKQAGMEIKEFPLQYMIDTVFPTGDDPWVGGSNFLRCFASIYMHLEGMHPSHDIRYWLYRKFLAVTDMGMVTTFTDKPDEHNYSFEAAHDFIGRLNRFTGYRYRVIETANSNKNKLFGVISRSMYAGRPVLALCYDQNHTYKFNRKWRLLIGYDHKNMTLSFNENGTVTVVSDWFEKLEKTMIVTQTGLPKSDIKDMFREIIDDVERSETQGEKYGYASSVI